MAMKHDKELSIDFTACDGHGLCAELLPELIGLDEWGYPVFRARTVPATLVRDARRAVAACPAMALRLASAPGTAPVSNSTKSPIRP
jgi:ferredoxin